MAAAHAGHAHCVRILLGHGANVHALTAAKRTALYFAAAAERLECIAELVKGGADVGAADNDGSTPLHAAAGEGRTDAARLLLALGAHKDVRNGPNRSGHTPFQLAMAGKRFETAQVLAAGPDAFAEAYARAAAPAAGAERAAALAALLAGLLTPGAAGEGANAKKVAQLLEDLGAVYENDYI